MRRKKEAAAQRCAAVFLSLILLASATACGNQSKALPAPASDTVTEAEEHRETEKEIQEPEEAGAAEEAGETGETEEVSETEEETPYEKALSHLISAADEDPSVLYTLDTDFWTYVGEAYGEAVLLSLADRPNGPLDWSGCLELTGRSLHVLWCEYLRDRGIESTDLQNVWWKDCVSPDETVMDFAGDINFMDGCGCMNYIEKNGGIEAGFSENLLEELRSADICMLNNEFAYSTRGEPLPGKSYTFRADPKKAGLLFSLGADIVGLANNHIFDYGEDALIDTIDTLDTAGMPHVGAGKNLEEASRCVYFIANGRKIAYTAATQIERSTSYTREATEDSAGVLKTLNPDRYCEVLSEAEKKADLVIAFVHWGTEGSFQYEGDQVELARRFAEAGADVIIGGHTHCLQGISYTEDVPVIYSIGNFWFSSTPTDGWRSKDMGIAQIRLQSDGEIVFRFLPCHQENWRTVLYSDGPEKERILALEQSLSHGITIDEDGYVKRE